MAAATITIPTRLCAAVTGSCRSTSMCPAARRRRRRCSTACCCCRRRSVGPARSSAEGPGTMDELEKLGQTIASALGSAVTAQQVVLGELSITTTAADLLKVMRFLRDDERCQFVSFIDVTAVDWPNRERRFDVVYHLLSPRKNCRIRVKLEVAEGTSVPTVIDIFPGANWFERETYDLYGVPFTG